MLILDHGSSCTGFKMPCTFPKLSMRIFDRLLSYPQELRKLYLPSYTPNETERAHGVDHAA